MPNPRFRPPSAWYCAKCETVIQVKGDKRDVVNHYIAVSTHMKVVHGIDVPAPFKAA